MQTARRLYMYLMSGVTLGVLLVGLNSLLTVALHAAGIGRGARIGGTADDRQQLSLAIALIVVGLIVWTIHWLLVERGLRADNPARDEERGSAIRALYLTIVLTALLAFGVLAGIQLLTELARRLVGFVDTDGFFTNDLGGSLATLLVTAAAWAYHAAIRRRDLSGTALSGAAAWIPRVYIYGAALLGLVLTSINIGTLLSGVLADVTGTVPDFGNTDFSGRIIADAVAGIIGWGIVMVGHWWYATSLIHDPGWRGTSERAARLRLAYFVAAIGASAIAIVTFGTQALSTSVGLALGVDDLVANDGALLAIGGPLLSLLPWIVAWWLHLRWMRAESMAAEDPSRTATVDRLDASVVSLVGLVAAAGGAAGLLGLLLDMALGGNRVDLDFWRADVARWLALGVIGAVLWLWHWMRLQRRSAASPVEEADSTIRRAYLLIVVAVALIASLGNVAYLLYRLLSSVLRVDLTDNVASEIALPLAALVVAATLAIYHGLVLRRDQALRGAAASAVAPSEEAETPGEPSVPMRRRLVLTGPPGTDLETTVAAMRAALGPELRLEDEAPEG
jgi:hypothetical protein